MATFWAVVVAGWMLPTTVWAEESSGEPVFSQDTESASEPSVEIEEVSESSDSSAADAPAAEVSTPAGEVIAAADTSASVSDKMAEMARLLDEQRKQMEALQKANAEEMEKMQKMMSLQREQISSLQQQVSTQGDAHSNEVRVAEIRKTVEQILADKQFAAGTYEPTMTAGYDRGFYIKTSDDTFMMKISGRTQFRYVGINRQSDNRNVTNKQAAHDTSGFEWERLRLYFKGWLWNTNLKYVLSIEGDSDGQHNLKFLDAFFNYTYAPKQSIQWGKMPLPYGKQAGIVSSAKYQMIDQSMANAMFNLGDSLGIQAMGDFKLGNQNFSYITGVYNGAANSDDDVRDLDTKFAYVARGVWHAIPGIDEADETDLIFHKTPALDFGTSFAYVDRERDANGPSFTYSVMDAIRAGRGGYGSSSSLASEFIQFGADATFKYRGFSLTSEYFLRKIDSQNKFSPWQRLTATTGSGCQQGGYVQGGYFIIPQKLEVVGRLGGAWNIGDDAAWEQALGVNYYVHGHAVKLSADVTHIDECPVSNSSAGFGINDDMMLYRLQVQVAME
jgi:hypothetical protein